MHYIFFYITFVLTYWIGSLITFMLDFIINYKRIINISKTELLNEYKKVIPTVFFNLHIVSLFVFFVCSPFSNILNLQFNVFKMVFDIFCSIFMIDFFLFLSHKIMHRRILYKWSHNVHHELKNPVGFAAFYNHWFDFIFAVMLPAIYPAIILSSHPYTALILMVLATTNAVFISHGGYDIKDKNHYLHHEKLNCNYGIGLYMDKLYGTEIN